MNRGRSLLPRTLPCVLPRTRSTSRLHAGGFSPSMPAHMVGLLGERRASPFAVKVSAWGAWGYGMIFVLCAVGTIPACVHPPASTFPGCGSDRDCRFDRICELGRCVWPPKPGGVPLAPADAGTDAGAVPSTAMVVPALAMHRFGPQHRGQSPFRLPKQQPHFGWSFSSGGPITSSPAVAPDGMGGWSVIVGSHDGRIYSLDRAGHTSWAYATGDLIFSSPAVGAALSAATAGAVVYVGSDDDYLYALDLATGQPRWRYRIGNCRENRGLGPEASRCDVDAGPTLGPDGTIYTGGDGIYAIHPNGTRKWKFPTGGHVSSAPALLADGTVIAGCQDNLLYALTSDGIKRWDSGGRH